MAATRPPGYFQTTDHSKKVAEIVCRYLHENHNDKFIIIAFKRDIDTFFEKIGDVPDETCSIEELRRIAASKDELSSENTILNQFDELLKKLKKRIASNVSIYYSGHNKTIGISISGSHDSPKYEFIYNAFSSEAFKTYLREQLGLLEISLGLQNVEFEEDHFLPEYPHDLKIIIIKRSNDDDELIGDLNRLRNERHMKELKHRAFNIAEVNHDCTWDEFQKTDFFKEFSDENSQLVSNLKSIVELEGPHDFSLVESYIGSSEEDKKEALIRGLYQIQGGREHKKQCSEGPIVLREGGRFTLSSEHKTPYGREGLIGFNIKLPVNDSPANLIFPEFDKISNGDQKKIHELLSNIGMDYKEKFEKITQKSLKRRLKSEMHGTLKVKLGEIKIIKDSLSDFLNSTVQDMSSTNLTFSYVKGQVGKPRWFEVHFTPPCRACATKAYHLKKQPGRKRKESRPIWDYNLTEVEVEEVNGSPPAPGTPPPPNRRGSVYSEATITTLRKTLGEITNTHTNDST